MSVLKELLYDWGGANLWLFHAVNDLRGPVLDRFMLVGTQIGSHTLFPIYLTLILLAATFAATRAAEIDPKQGQDLAIRWLSALSILCIASLLDGAFLSWAKHWFDYPRPLLALPQGSVNVVGEAEYRRSLPSGHASFATLIGASLWPMLGKRQRWVVAFFVIWVGVSRVNVGAHFPADILASWLTALLAVMVVKGTLDRFLVVVSAASQHRPPQRRQVSVARQDADPGRGQ
jgi:membrane-associated phospholipid phosphatase